jgi:ribose transport system ATP-binding protein
MSEILRVENITKTFQGITALDDVFCSVNKGNIHALVGENGAGKSTLIKILAGVYSEYKGSIFIEKAKKIFDSPHQAQQNGISTIFQELTIVPKLTIAENIFLGKEPIKNKILIDTEEMHRRSKELLDFIGTRLKTDTPAGRLSIANQQIVEICKALVLDAKIIIMDEPTASLTDYEVGQLFQIIKRLKNDDKTVLYVSHRLKEVFDIADQITVLRDGKYIGTKEKHSTNPKEIVRMMVGRSMEAMFPARTANIGTTVLSIKNLTKTGEFENVSLELHHGEVLGIGGLIGAGRTEMAKAIMGLSNIEHGTIKLFNNEISYFKHPRKAMNNGITYLPEDRKGEGLFHQLSVRTNITLAIIKQIITAGIFVKEKKERAIAQTFIDKMRIAIHNMEQRADTLSGGNQQKVIISRLLASGAKIFIFDEPTRGVDVGAKYEIYNIMKTLTEEGNSVLFITSELEELIGISDRVILMKDGRTVKELQKEEFDPQLIMNILTLGE